jgi:hypothetical protein
MIECQCSLQFTTVCDMRLPSNHKFDCPERARLLTERGETQAIPVFLSQVEPVWKVESKADPETLRRIDAQGEDRAPGDQL